MSVIGTPIDTSLLQAAQAQQVAGKARDRERASSEGRVRARDLVELRVAGVEGAEAVRRLPHNDSEQAEAERDARRGGVAPERRGGDGEESPRRIDVHA